MQPSKTNTSILPPAFPTPKSPDNNWNGDRWIKDMLKKWAWNADITSTAATNPATTQPSTTVAQPDTTTEPGITAGTTITQPSTTITQPDTTAGPGITAGTTINQPGTTAQSNTAQPTSIGITSCAWPTDNSKPTIGAPGTPTTTLILPPPTDPWLDNFFSLLNKTAKPTTTVQSDTASGITTNGGAITQPSSDVEKARLDAVTKAFWDAWNKGDAALADFNAALTTAIQQPGETITQTQPISAGITSCGWPTDNSKPTTIGAPITTIMQPPSMDSFLKESDNFFNGLNKVDTATTAQPDTDTATTITPPNANQPTTAQPSTQPQPDSPITTLEKIIDQNEKVLNELKITEQKLKDSAEESTKKIIDGTKDVKSNFDSLQNEYNSLENSLKSLAKNNTWIQTLNDSLKTIAVADLAKSVLGFQQTSSTVGIIKLGLDTALFKNQIENAIEMLLEMGTATASKLSNESITEYSKVKEISDQATKYIAVLESNLQIAKINHAPYEQQQSSWHPSEEYKITKAALVLAEITLNGAKDLAAELKKIIEVSDKLLVTFDKISALKENCLEISNAHTTLEKQKKELIDVNQQVKGQTELLMHDKAQLDALKKKMDNAHDTTLDATKVTQNAETKPTSTQQTEKTVAAADTTKTADTASHFSMMDLFKPSNWVAGASNAIRTATDWYTATKTADATHNLDKPVAGTDNAILTDNDKASIDKLNNIDVAVDNANTQHENEASTTTLTQNDINMVEELININLDDTKTHESDITITKLTQSQ
ncbi:MAG: hypothetical protein JSS07_10220, partial [Proteobacteria bacterium]|nr:hypothetical protein [Pseudomonadota bacterium]